MFNCKKIWHIKGIGRSPYKALFGDDPKGGILDLPIPKDVLNEITTEEELAEHLGENILEENESE